MNVTAVLFPFGGDYKWPPFLFAGIGYSALIIQRDYSNFNAEYFSFESLLERLGLDTVHRLPGGVPIIPVGVGIRYRLTGNLSLTSEVSYRIMSTDYLDGFSHSGNPEKRDHYQIFNRVDLFASWTNSI
jgi:hypothetical protein